MKIVDYYVDKEFNLYFEILFFSFSIFIVTALMLFFKHKILDILQIISLDFCVFIFISIVKMERSKPYLIIYYTNNIQGLTKSKSEIIDYIVNNRVFYNLKFKGNDVVYNDSFYITENEYNTIIKNEYKQLEKNRWCLYYYFHYH